jgi:hypothetical protein
MKRRDRGEIKFDQDGRLDLIDLKVAKEAEITDESIIQSGSASGTQVAAIPEVNKKEPWTGIWKVEASSRVGRGIWRLKQRGKSVVSTRDSMNEAKGKVKGDQLKGLWGSGVRFVIKISSDRQSFEGKIEAQPGATGTGGNLKGKRIK